MYFRSNYNDLEKLDDEHFVDAITQIINKENECEFLDFKKEVHTNNAELLLDIISMANNIDEKDGLLIIGVKDKVAYDVDMVKFEEYVVNLLLDNRRKFASQSIPTIYIRNTIINEKNIKVIIIKNSIKTPFYLTDGYSHQGVSIRAYEIHTRYLSNKRLASDYEVEKLWAKRFGLNKTSLEKFLHLSNDGWRFVNKNSVNYADKYVFNEVNPEYTIHFSEAKGMNNYPYSKTLNIFNGYEKNYKGKLQIWYHSVVIFEDDYYFMKDCEYTMHNQRYLPKFSKLVITDTMYYLLDTIPGKLIRILNDGKLNFSNGRELLEYGHYLVFYNQSDLAAFVAYVIEHLNINTQAYDKYGWPAFEHYVDEVFASDDFQHCFHSFVEEAMASDFSSLPTNYKRLLSEEFRHYSKEELNKPPVKIELFRIMEKAYQFILYSEWRNINADEYNQFLENMA